MSSEQVELSDRVVGIDLGTTNSAIALLREGVPVVLENERGELLTPSAVARDTRTGEIVVGRAAKDILAVHPEAGVAFFKRSMGRDHRFSLGKEGMSPVELSGCVLAALLKAAGQQLGEPVRRCVLTVPAYFDESQRVATMEAGRLAGVEVVRIINEPTAAAICYGLHERDKETTFVVFDLGGGTLDVCVMELFEGSLEVLSTAGVSLLGGEDFTSALRKFLLKRLGLVGEHVELNDPEAYALLYARSELAKRRLSEELEVEISVPPIKGSKLSSPQTMTLTQAEAHLCWEPLLRQLVDPIRSALRGARLKPRDVSEVILVGGATRMPCVRAAVREVLDLEPLDRVDPDLAIAQGAAIQAALCENHQAVSDIVVSDVASHSLGVDFCREMAGTFVNGYFAPVIHRNTVLPTSRSKTFVTAHPNQRGMDFGVYEGEARRVEENRLIGRLSVKGIPKGPAGQEVAVTFTFDLNGVLEVEAKVSTGRTFTALFDRSMKPLEKRELEIARRRIAEIRADPVQRPELRDLLARADLLVREIVGFERDLLASAIASLEDAIASHTPSLIEAAQETLKGLCDQLSGDERW